MFARKVICVIEPGEQPVPVAWLDSFCMRSFTGSAAFDDTLPIADGLLEAGLRVSLKRLREELESWCRRKGWLTPEATLRIAAVPAPGDGEQGSHAAPHP